MRIDKLNNGIIIHYKGTIHENTKCEEGNEREGKGDAALELTPNGIGKAPPTTLVSAGFEYEFGLSLRGCCPASLAV